MTRSRHLRNLPSPARDEVAGWLRAQIKAGRFKPGERLPSSRELGERFDACQDTGARALALMGEEGLAVRGEKRHHGWFVKIQR